MINENLDYEKRSSSLTSRLSARRRSAPASSKFKSAILKVPHINQVAWQNDRHKKVHEHEHNDVGQQQQGSTSLAFHAGQNGVKLHQNQNGKKKGYQCRQYEQQRQRHGIHGELLVPSKDLSPQTALQDYDCMKLSDDSTIDAAQNQHPASVQQAKQRKDWKRVSESLTN